jgi:hypothetical protein
MKVGDLSLHLLEFPSSPEDAPEISDVTMPRGWEDERLASRNEPPTQMSIQLLKILGRHSLSS